MYFDFPGDENEGMDEECNEKGEEEPSKRETMQIISKGRQVSRKR